MNKMIAFVKSSFLAALKAKNNFLVTAHFGIAYDAGCISVRKINSPVDLPVIFSIYEVCNVYLTKKMAKEK